MTTVDFLSSNWTTFSITPLCDNGLNLIDYEPKVKVLCVAQGIYWSFWRAMHKSLMNCMWSMVYSWSLVLLTSQQLKRKLKTQRQRWTHTNRMRQCASTSSCPLSRHISVWRSNPLQYQIKCVLVSVWMSQTSQQYRQWTLNNFSRPWSLLKMQTLLLMSQRWKLIAGKSWWTHYRWWPHSCMNSLSNSHWNLYQNSITPQFRLLIPQIPSMMERPLQKISLWYSYERLVIESSWRHRTRLESGEALAAYANRNWKSKVGGKGRKQGSKSNKLVHKLANCYGPGGGKEGQGPHQKNQKGQKSRKQEDLTSSANVTSQSDMKKEGGTMFTFSVTLLFHCIAVKLGIPSEQCSAILNSGASTTAQTNWNWNSRISCHN